MAFTNAPTVSTYSTKNVPAAYDMQVRANSSYFNSYTGVNQDQGMINIIPRKYRTADGQDTIIGETRLPIHAYPVGSTGQICRGAYVWEKVSTYYFCVVNTVVYSSTDGITWTALITFATNVTTPVRFTEFIDATNTKSLIVVDGIEGWVITSNAIATQIVDADFPTPHVPFPVFLDGYLFLAKSGTGDIYNSDLNAPSSWTAGSFISSELYPDDVQAIVKVQNYLLAIGSQGCEFFYDAANAVASPLARLEGASLPFGTQLPNSIASNKNMVVMVANNNDGENTIVAIEDLKHKEINPSFLISLLNYRFNQTSTTTSQVRGFFIRQGGKLNYVLALDGTSTTQSISNGSYAYNFDTGWWVELRYGVDGSFPFPVHFNAPSSSGNLTNFVAGHMPHVTGGPASGISFFGKMEEGSAAGSGLPLLASDVIVTGTQGSQLLYQEVRTPNFDFGTLNSKMMYRFGVIVQDYVSSNVLTTPTLGVTWNDDDYNSANYWPVQTLDSSGAYNYPFITQLGIFRKRSFKLTHNAGYFLQYIGLEMDINKGQQ